jgi:hypothetical protein
MSSFISPAALVSRKKPVNTNVPSSPESLRRSAPTGDRQRLNQEADYYEKSDAKYYGKCTPTAAPCLRSLRRVVATCAGLSHQLKPAFPLAPLLLLLLIIIILLSQGKTTRGRVRGKTPQGLTAPAW